MASLSFPASASSPELSKTPSSSNGLMSNTATDTSVPHRWTRRRHEPHMAEFVKPPGMPFLRSIRALERDHSAPAPKVRVRADDLERPVAWSCTRHAPEMTRFIRDPRTGVMRPAPVAGERPLCKRPDRRRKDDEVPDGWTVPIHATMMLHAFRDPSTNFLHPQRSTIPEPSDGTEVPSGWTVPRHSEHLLKRSR